MLEKPGKPTGIDVPENPTMCFAPRIALRTSMQYRWLVADCQSLKQKNFFNLWVGCSEPRKSPVGGPRKSGPKAAESFRFAARAGHAPQRLPTGSWPGSDRRKPCFWPGIPGETNAILAANDTVRRTIRVRRTRQPGGLEATRRADRAEPHWYNQGDFEPGLVPGATHPGNVG